MMKKRILQFRMTAVTVMIGLLLGAIGIKEGNAQSFTYCNLNYSVNEDGTSVTLTGGTTASSGTLIIPETVNNEGIYYSVTKIGNYAFYGTTKYSGDLIIPNSITSIDDGAFQQSSFSGSLVIGNSVLTIGSLAFYSCGFSGSLIIGESVEIIGNSAFHSCQFVGNLIIPNTVTTIGEMAFCGCNGFSGSLEIPNSVITIGNSAFMECSGFTGTFVLPNSVTTIGHYAFSGCIGFSGNLIIPNSITEISEGVFESCSGFSGSLVIPNTVTKVGMRAFLQCTGLSGNLSIPNSVSVIEEEAFYNCTGFTGSLSLPNSVTTIGREAFCHCSGITSISIPKSVVDLYGNAFYGTGWYENQAEGFLYLDNWCLGYKGTEAGPLYIQEGIENIANQAFLYRLGFDEIKLPNSIKTIGVSAFGNCSSINGKLIMPSSVTTIGRNAFYNCIGLTSIQINSASTSIGIGAFIYCNGLNSITVLTENVPIMEYGAFYEVSKLIPVYVPYGCVEAYATASGWSDFTNYQEIAYKSIPGYTESNNNWQFIASPFVENTSPTTIDDMLPTSGTYDLYRFDQTEDEEWQNYKANNFNLTNGQGYLYANTEEVNLIFKGEFNEGETKEISLAYDANAEFAGWNLVGNPFPVNAYTNKSYYLMNEAGTAIEPVAVSMETAIPACTGVMVKADNTGETITFSKAASRGQDNQGVLQIALAKANTRSKAVEDKVLVSFNEGDQLGKFVFNQDNAKLYIPQGKEQYAIAYAETTSEIPLNFEAHKNGTYVISVNPEMAEMEYLHLIDNLTGNDVDLLLEPSYTFEAKTTDYASRFRLVFSICEDANSDNETFAYFNGNEWMVINTGRAVLQVLDMQGHVLSSEQFSGSYEKQLDVAPGVYMLRLIQGDDVKTQKIVVR